MRIVIMAQVLGAALLLSGCPGAPASDPTGGMTSGGEGGKVDTSSSSSSSGKGGEGGKASGAGGNNSGGAAGSGGNGSSNGGAGGAGAGSGAGGNNTGGNGSGGNNTGGNGAGGNGMAVCPGLLGDLNTKQDNATNCNIDMPQDKQCGNFIDGLCCPIAVTNLNSPEVIAYLAALQAYLAAGCMPSCPPVPCPANPTVSCVAGANGADCVVGP
jgi:hypothetical protein